MRKVSKEEFLEHVGQLDVEVSVRGRYRDDDYGTDFLLKGTRELVGRTRQVGPHPHHKPDTDYYLPTEHDHDKEGCGYLGMGLWDCGHDDQH